VSIPAPQANLSPVAYHCAHGPARAREDQFTHDHVDLLPARNSSALIRPHQALSHIRWLSGDLQSAPCRTPETSGYRTFVGFSAITTGTSVREMNKTTCTE
jgi:hypothetical protein